MRTHQFLTVAVMVLVYGERRNNKRCISSWKKKAKAHPQCSEEVLQSYENTRHSELDRDGVGDCGWDQLHTVPVQRSVPKLGWQKEKYVNKVDAGSRSNR